MFLQAAVLEHQLDDFAQRAAAGLLAQHIDLGGKSAQVGTGFAGHGTHRVVHGATRGAGDVLQLLDAARTNAARREINDAQKAGVVVRVLQQTQVGQRVLDLSAFKKAQTTVHPVRHAGVEERRFHHPTLGVAAVQQRDFFARSAVAHQLLDLVDKPLRFSKVAGRFVDTHRLAGAGFGAQVFTQAFAVVADEVVRRIQDIAEAAVIALQLDLMLDLELPHEIGHVANARAPEGVNALVVVADRHHRTAGHRVCACGGVVALPGQHLDPSVLQFVGVLKLVNQDVAKTPLVMLSHSRVVTQQLVTAQHQLAKIDHAFALALFFIQGVNLDLFAAFFVAHRHVFGTLAVFLAGGNEPSQLLGRKALVVDVELFAQALDGRELVLGVQNLKALRQIRHLAMRPQKTVAQAVKRPDPHAAHIHRQHVRQAGHHFLGGLVGEGDRQNATGRDLPGLQQPSDAGGQHPRLARTGAGEDQRMRVGQRHRGQLLRI